jgi:hypothetical protein
VSHRRRPAIRPEDDPEYIAEYERAVRSISWGCVLFILGMVAVALVVLVLASFFAEFPIFRPVK